MNTNPDLLINKIFNANSSNFEELALEVFNYQYINNEVYRQYCNILKINCSDVVSYKQIPFLPIELFKTHKIISSEFKEDLIFESSGTTSSVNSKHYVVSKEVYETSFLKSFKVFYGDINQYCTLGLLPSYLEKGNSSLVYMVDKLINLSQHNESGFFLYDFENLKRKIIDNEAKGQKSLLVGVTYALLDFFDLHPMKLSHTIVMETGGMKGRKIEMSRTEVHNHLKLCTGNINIHSEYGMTELLSQAYS
ncbi:MAG: acyl transferase, partial [Ferruginibacter sp.]